MKKHLLTNEKNYFKANLHSHSNISDGRLSPEEMKQAYKEKGYSILCITDHDIMIDHSDLNDEDMLFLKGLEMEFNAPHYPGVDDFDDISTCHICFYSRDPKNKKQPNSNVDFNHAKCGWCHSEEMRNAREFYGERFEPRYTPDDINKIIRLANENGFIVTVNHIMWSMEPYEQYIHYDGMFATEIFNTGCHVGGHDDRNSYIFDLLLKKGKRLFCVCADDNHNGSPLDSQYSDSFGGWVMVNTDKLEYETVFAALEKGDFYSSCGPEIKELYVDVENDTIHIETSNARSIRFISESRRKNIVIAQKGGSVTSADFKLSRARKYFRIEVEDFEGKLAYSNPYFLDELTKD